MKSTSSLLVSCCVAALFVTSTACAQFNWSNWTYPSSNTATAGAGGGFVNLTVTGQDISAVSTVGNPIMFQPGFPYTQVSGTSAGAINSGFGTNYFQMELDFSGIADTTGLVLAIGNLGNFPFPGYSQYGYVMTAFDASANPIALSTFGQYGNFDFLIPGTGYSLNDDLSLDINDGKFYVTKVQGQNDRNSDMLIFSLPPGVDKIDIKLKNPHLGFGDTINFMVSAPIPEPSAMTSLIVGIVISAICVGQRNRKVLGILSGIARTFSQPAKGV